MSYPYVTTTELERELPFGATDLDLDETDFDLLLEAVLEREADRVEEWAGTTFELTSISEELDGSGEAEQPLPNRPVDDISSLVVTDSDDTDHTIDVTNGSTEVWINETYVELRDDAPIDVFADETRNVAITYTYGYDGAPGPIQEAIVRLARKGLDMKETDGVTQEAEGGFSYTFVPPRRLRRAVCAEVREHRPPSYYGGIQMS